MYALCSDCERGGTVAWAGREWNAYHVIFALSLLMRWLCIPLARRIREQGSTRSMRVLNDVIGEFPQRFLRFPVGLYRRFVPDADDVPASESDAPTGGR